MAQFFQLPIYRDGRLQECMNIERETVSKTNIDKGYSDLWSVTNYPRPNRKASLLSVRIC